MKILLTGAGGFIGYNVYRYLLNLGYDVEVCIRKYYDEKFFPTEKVWYGCDLTKSDTVKSILDKVNPSCIIHLAGIATTKQDDSNPYGIVDNNVKSTFNLLQHCKDDCRFIFASTVLVYGGQKDATESTTISPTGVYGATKIACEGLISAYATIKNIRATSMRLCATVGPKMTHGLVYDIVKKLRSNSPNLELFGDSPGSIKPFIHVDDVCRAIQFFLKNDFYGSYNICPNDNISVKNIATEIMRVLEINKPIVWQGKKSLWKGDNNLIQCSPNKVWQAGFRPEYTNSISAIAKVVRNFKE